MDSADFSIFMELGLLQKDFFKITDKLCSINDTFLICHAQFFTCNGRSFT